MPELDRSVQAQFAVPYRVVPCAPEHIAQVAELQRHLWSPDVDLNTRYLQWKYYRNPYIGEPLLYLAFCGQQLVGMRGAFGTKWEIGEPAEQFLLPYPDDLVVDPAHRLKGLPRIIMEFSLADLNRRGYRFVINLSASRVTALISLRMKWRSAGAIGSLHRRTLRRTFFDGLIAGIRHLPVLWRWGDRFAAFCGESGDRVFQPLEAWLSKPRRSQSAASLFVESAPRAREMELLVRRLPKDGHIRHVRDETYFDWRFANPLRSYRFVYAARDRLDGYLVLQRSLGDVDGRVSIVDWEAENDAVRAELLAAVVDHGAFPALRAWAQASCPAATQVLERRGFSPVHTRHDYQILVRPAHDDDLPAPWTLGGRRLDNAADWDPRMIYSMIG